MTDDFPIEGEDGGYVPCFELPAPLIVEEEGAIYGVAGGRVPRGNAAGSLPAPERAAIVGSGVGFVAKPCEESLCPCCDTFARVVGLGWGPSELCPDWITAKPGVASSVDGAAAALAWDDNGTPAHLTAAQYLPLGFTGLPVEFQTRIKTSPTNDAAIWLSDSEFFSGGGPTASIWIVDVLGLDLRITVDGPAGGIGQAIVVGAFPASDTYINIRVLCEARSIKIRAWNVGDPDPGVWQATASYSSGFAVGVTPSLIEYMGGTFLGSGVGGSITVDELCILQGYPCILPSDILTGFRGTRYLTATAMGGPTSVYSGPTYVSTGLLGAEWNCYDVATGGNMGDREYERRSFLTWIMPLTTTYVTIVGTAVAALPVTDLETNGRPQDTTVEYEMGPVTFDPLVGPADFDDTGTGFDGTVTYLDADPQVPVPINLLSSALSTWLDVAGDYGPPGETWKLFQLAIRNVSPVGIGRHSLGLPEEIEVIDRFPDNPDWQHGFTPPGFYLDYSQVQSAVVVDVEVFAHG